MKKTILIDMYGVIIKESKGYFIPYTYEHFPESEHDRITNAFRVEKVFTKAGNGELSSYDFIKYLGYEDPDATMKDYIDHYLTLDEGFIPFAENILEDFDMILLSNDVSEWSEYIIQKHGLAKYFSHRVVSGDVHMRKPDEKIYQYALDTYNRNPKDCVFIDNSTKNLLVADKLGITPILFNRDHEEYNGITVNNFAELAESIDKLCV